jgi:site-specific recombinase XerD
MKIKRPTFKIILFKSKALNAGTHPIMIRATYNRERRYYSLGYSAAPENWNETLGRYERKRLTEEERKANLIFDNYSKRLHDLEDYFERVGFTFTRFEKKFFNVSTGKVLEFFGEVIKDLETEKRYGSASTYKDTLARLKEFKSKEFTFHDIDLKFLQQFEKHLKKTNSVASCGIYLRTLRAVFNRAIQSGLVKQDVYPFGEFKIKSAPARKRALLHEHIKTLKGYRATPGTRLWHSLNLFLFSYFARGMNLADIAALQWKDVHNNRIYYKRKKTGDLIDILIDEKLASILANYSGNEGFIFPILETGLTPKTERGRIKARLKKINQDLQAIATETGLPEDITFYWGRHSYATTLMRSGVSVSLIQKTLGHSTEAVTQKYLDSFETSQLDKIGELL